ncbi:restriction endonuclease [Pedobacter sp. SL55]|uniref:restriction endonuclease n=1 Tax=Pedobacter sp. SL55 TaxID=2995161 RepID=UPI002271D084|nr:restriction endonuclease [Pedobacter sp. SL55]WAC41066.1 restriction endonuclease [Pedobacter sp. SL55]
MKTDKDWQAYEQVTKYIYEALGRLNGVEILGCGNDCRRKGKSGSQYQIDVLTQTTSKDKSFLTAIECKYVSKKVGREVVMKLSALLDDTGIEKGIVVSKNGFTKEALKYAEHKSIRLVELDNHKKYEVNKNVINIAEITLNLNVEITRPEILCLKVDDIELKPASTFLGPFWYGQIQTKSNSPIALQNYIDDFRRELGRLDLIDKVKYKDIDFPEGSLFKENQEVNAKVVTKLSISGVLTSNKEVHIREITLVDKIRMIMKNIFEQEMFAITQHGAIDRI